MRKTNRRNKISRRKRTNQRALSSRRRCQGQLVVAYSEICLIITTVRKRACLTFSREHPKMKTRTALKQHPQISLAMVALNFKNQQVEDQAFLETVHPLAPIFLVPPLKMELLQEVACFSSSQQQARVSSAQTTPCLVIQRPTCLPRKRKTNLTM